MLIALLWAAGAIGVGAYMLVALLRPEGAPSRPHPSDKNRRF